MFLLLLISVFTFNQPKIDSSLKKIEGLKGEPVSAEVKLPIEYPESMGSPQLYLSEFEKSSLLGDIVVGDEPGETLSITGDFYNQGDIMVINDGVVEVRNADFNLAGNIYTSNKGEISIDSSTVNFLQDYIYQNIIQVMDTASFSIKNSETSFNGYPINVNVSGWADFTMDNTYNKDWITAVVVGKGSAYLEEVTGYSGEWLFADACECSFNNVDYILTWYFFPDSSIADLTFPGEDTIYNFSMDSTKPGVQGIDYSVSIDSSTQCMWATIPLKGSDVQINDSELRVTGLMFQGADSFNISGLVNDLHYDDYTLPVDDRNYHLLNTSVQTWNLYPSDSVNVELSSSIFGELCGFDKSYTTIMNAFCDGSGGHLEVDRNSFMIVGFSSISADIITKDRGICLVAHSSMPMGRIWSTGSSILIFINTMFAEQPVPSDTSIIFNASITSPSEAQVDDTVGISGSAWIDVGPYQSLDFSFYRLHYRLKGDSLWQSMSGEKYTEVRMDTLDSWNTSGLETGTYELRLLLKDTAGDSVEALKDVSLKSSGIEDDTFKEEKFKVKRIKNRLFLVSGISENSEIEIYDILGQRIGKIKKNNSQWLAPGGGIYIFKDRWKEVTRKVIVY